jgi:small nuclear ribonucleoprotein (snRNP)-like protein
MLKRLCAVMLSALLLQAAAVPAFAATNAEREARRAEKVRTQLTRLGTGREARVRVELRDKTKLEGYLSAADADTFAVTDNSGKTTAVPYQQVRKAQGNNLSTGAKVAIGIGIGVGVLIIIALIAARHFGD